MLLAGSVRSSCFIVVEHLTNNPKIQGLNTAIGTHTHTHTHTRRERERITGAVVLIFWPAVVAER